MRIRAWLRYVPSLGLGGSLLCHLIPSEVSITSFPRTYRPTEFLSGLLVSLVILRQGISLFSGAFGELTDAGVSQRTHRTLLQSLTQLSRDSSSPLSQPSLLHIADLRAMRSGALMFVDVSVHVPPSLPISDAVMLENKIRETLVGVRQEISEVRVKFIPSGGDHDSDGEENLPEEEVKQEKKESS